MGHQCPQCGDDLTGFRVKRRHNAWGASVTGPRDRPELWWECGGCEWLGVQAAPDDPMRPLRRLPGTEGTCDFCGWEDSVAAGEPARRADGLLVQWIVCLTCGFSGSLRLRES